MITAIAAFCLDAVIGDPGGKWHPVALMGKFIALIEKILYPAPKRGDNAKLAAGILLVAIVVVISYAAGDLLLYGAAILQSAYDVPYLSDIVTVVVLSFMISPKSLAGAGLNIYTLLMAKKNTQARQAVGMIVGRDTQKMNAAEITRATVETIAENTVDGVIAPLFWFMVGGLPLAVLYRAANTMDSMLGYKNERYLFFGRAAARLDDVLNYVPARITGVLLVAAAWLLKYDHHYAMEIMRRDAKKHPSPNGGYPESAVAGALNIRLGGMNFYFGQPSFREYMGDAVSRLQPKHIRSTVALMYTATVLFLTVMYVAERICR